MENDNLKNESPGFLVGAVSGSTALEPKVVVIAKIKLNYLNTLGIK